MPESVGILGPGRVICASMRRRDPVPAESLVYARVFGVQCNSDLIAVREKANKFVCDGNLLSRWGVILMEGLEKRGFHADRSGLR